MKLSSGKTTGEVLGYKITRDNRLVILQIPSSAQHNMDRSNIKNKQYAKYRCSEAVVKEIVDLSTGERVSESCSKYDSSFKYKTGKKVVTPDFDTNLENVCTGGIHYFLDRKHAERYERLVADGEYKEWHENGQQSLVCFFNNGKPDGEYKEWHENGQQSFVCFYRNGQSDGEYKRWYDNGQQSLVCFFNNGKPDGEYKEWHENGQQSFVCFYGNGQSDGEYKRWYDNGQQSFVCFFNNGKIDGEYKEWHENGQQSFVCFFNNGKIDGEYKSWDLNGKNIFNRFRE